MNHFRITFCMLILFTFMGACTRAPSSQVNFAVSLQAVTSENGGVLLRVLEVGGQSRILDFKLTSSPYIADIPQGNWDFFVVAFDGTSAWTGTGSCGSKAAVDLSSAEVTVELIAHSSNCSKNNNYLNLAYSVGQTFPAQFDYANFDSPGVVWGP